MSDIQENTLQQNRTERRQMVLESLKRRYETGSTYVKANQIADDTGLSAGVSGIWLKKLCEDGYIEMYNDGANYKLYRMTDAIEEVDR